MTKALGLVLLFALTNASLLLLFPFSVSRLVLVAVLYAGGTAVMLVLLFHPRSRWLLDRRTEVPCAGRPCVALTFDDGPSPEITPRVLDILREKQVKATFFLVGQQVERHPDLARRMQSRRPRHRQPHLLAPAALLLPVAAAAARRDRAGAGRHRPRHGRSAPPLPLAGRPAPPDPEAGPRAGGPRVRLVAAADLRHEGR